jgi:hypothetical protein
MLISKEVLLEYLAWENPIGWMRLATSLLSICICIVSSNVSPQSLIFKSNEKLRLLVVHLLS